MSEIRGISPLSNIVYMAAIHILTGERGREEGKLDEIRSSYKVIPSNLLLKFTENRILWILIDSRFVLDVLGTICIPQGANTLLIVVVSRPCIREKNVCWKIKNKHTIYI